MSENLDQAIQESRNSRNRIRRYGAHMIRHAFGALGNLQFFNPQKFEADCMAELETRQGINTNVIGEINVLPLHLPPDPHALEAISEFARKGNPKITDHTLKNVNAFRQWEEEVARQEELLLQQENERESPDKAA